MRNILTLCFFVDFSNLEDEFENFVKLLIKYGANPNDTQAQLPLFAAALYKDKQKIEYLLDIIS